METEKLIMLVRNRRFLYDAKDNNYKNRGIVAEAWLEIAREMGNENGKQWATKWKSLRDNYKKFKKSTETAAYKKYKNWPWADQLRFLDDTIALNETDSNISENRDSTSQVSDSTNQPSPSNSVDLRDSVSENLSRPGSSNSSYSRNSAKNKNVTQKGDSDLQQQLYATSMKKMPARMQSMLKLDMATLFAKYEMQIQDNINITPVNSPSTNLSTANSYKYSSEDSMLQDVEDSQGLPELSSHEMDELLHDTQHVQSNEVNQDQNITEFSELRRCYEEAAERSGLDYHAEVSKFIARDLAQGESAFAEMREKWRREKQKYEDETIDKQTSEDKAEKAKMKKTNELSFLSNDKNKDRLIDILSRELQAAGIETDQDFEDADRLIVTTALKESSIYDSATYIGEDR
ncbi:uncharacterized protein LOC121736249 [Aricia agestis]|uniref:uncharacterized protein LOC121736249 n=1 Tax=Aricia agestis TaxID=91739 RepID=UPI001C201A50|nr:uncharacterized protein LOC121736249 [Aricia agestis]